MEENILADGEVYEPICVWNGTIVDGHNRWRIIQAHPEIPYRVKEMPFADKWEAFDWMYKKQLGRRNLSDENKTYLWGKLYEARKRIVGAPKGNTNAKKNNVSKVDTLNCKSNDRIAESMAEELGIGNGTVLRAAQFANGIDSIKEMSAEAADKILSGRAKVTKKSVQEFKKLDEPEKKQFVDSVLTGRTYEPSTGTDHSAKIKETKHIQAVSADMSNIDKSVVYTEQDAVDELVNMIDEFLEKVERMLRIRSKVTMRSKTIAGLLDEASDKVLNLKGEIKCQ